jgi:Tfp pilus assembly protein PilO
LQINAKARSPATTELSPQDQLKRFYASFPKRSSLPEALMLLHHTANQRKLFDTHAEYRDAPEAGTPLLRMRIEIPVTGNYTDIRNWLGDLLQAEPALILDGLTLQRNDSSQNQLDARMRFLLFLRSGA